MNAKEFEDRVWAVEGIRIVLRCDATQEVGSYDYTNAMGQTTSITDWLKGRVTPNLKNIQAEVVAGNGVQPHGRSLVRTVKSGYSKE